MSLSQVLLARCRSMLKLWLVGKGRGARHRDEEKVGACAVMDRRVEKKRRQHRCTEEVEKRVVLKRKEGEQSLILLSAQLLIHSVRRGPVDVLSTLLRSQRMCSRIACFRAFMIDSWRFCSLGPEMPSQPRTRYTWSTASRTMHIVLMARYPGALYLYLPARRP